MEPVDGFNATQGLPEPFASDPALRHQMGLSMVDGIAALGAVDYVAVGLTGLGKPDNYLERQVSRWKAQLESYSDTPEWDGRKDLPGVNRVGDWLEANRPSDFRAGIIHGDYHLANVMFRFDEPKLAAIVDWELTTIGDPLLDLGWLMATWPDEADTSDAGTVAVQPWEGFPTADELIAHYAGKVTGTFPASTGTACSPATSWASSWKAPMRAPALARRRKRQATICTDELYGCSNAHCAGSAEYRQ